MAEFPLTLEFLGERKLGFFGCGHLGQGLAQALVSAGFPKEKMLLCHKGGEQTNEILRAKGLGQCIASNEEVCGNSKILFYLVRPQDAPAIKDYLLSEDCLVVSFLAGVPCHKLKEFLSGQDLVRVIPSAPDTILERDGIAVVFPEGSQVLAEILTALHLELIPLEKEDDLHAFTALAICLPNALIYWQSQGKKFEEQDLRPLEEKHHLKHYAKVMAWAQRMALKKLSEKDVADYIKKAATKGGITEAIIEAIDQGQSLLESLEQGIKRSHDLARHEHS